MLAGRVWPVERAFALATIEAGEMAACQRRPEHAVAIEVTAARPISRQRWLVDFGECGVRRIRSWVEAHDVPGDSQRRPPDGPIDRIHGHAVYGRHDPLVLYRLDRLIRLNILVPLAVTVGVEAECRPVWRVY